MCVCRYACNYVCICLDVCLHYACIYFMCSCMLVSITVSMSMLCLRLGYVYGCVFIRETDRQTKTQTGKHIYKQTERSVAHQTLEDIAGEGRDDFDAALRYKMVPSMLRTSRYDVATEAVLSIGKICGVAYQRKLEYPEMDKVPQASAVLIYSPCG